MNNIYEIDGDHIEHMENAFFCMNTVDRHDMIHEYKHSYNHIHLVHSSVNFNELDIDI
jgi:hypothetical protein